MEYFAVDLCDNNPFAAHEAQRAQDLLRAARQLSTLKRHANGRNNHLAAGAAWALEHIGRLRGVPGAAILALRRWRRFDEVKGHSCMVSLAECCRIHFRHALERDGYPLVIYKGRITHAVFAVALSFCLTKHVILDIGWLLLEPIAV